jgi:hypothetical protein
MIFEDEKYGQKWIKKMDQFYFECWQQTLLLQKIKQKKQGGNNLCWFLPKTIQ